MFIIEYNLGSKKSAVLSNGKIRNVKGLSAPTPGPRAPGPTRTGLRSGFLGRSRGLTGRAYLSGMGLWFRGFEEGVWQFPHPHGYGRGHDSVFRVHHGVKKSLQVCLGVAPYMDDLVSRRRVVLGRIHCPKTACELYVRGWVSEYVAFRNSQKVV